MWNLPGVKGKTTQNKLKSLLGYVGSVADFSDTGSSNTAIFALIKTLTDKMVLDGVVNLLTTDKNPMHPDPDSFFMRGYIICNWHYDVKQRIYQAFYENEKKIAVDIDLSRDPVLTCPWNGQRLIRSLSSIGSPDNPWQEDVRNHYAKLLLPMGVTFVWNGLHSTFTGMVKRDGIISINSGSNHSVHDISTLYPLLQFDGTNYLIAGSDVVAGKAASFEFGCIFEIGRLLHEKGICFKNLNREPSSK